MIRPESGQSHGVVAMHHQWTSPVCAHQRRPVSQVQLQLPVEERKDEMKFRLDQWRAAVAYLYGSGGGGGTKWPTPEAPAAVGAIERAAMSGINCDSCE